jgi:hypothetical protein
MGGNYWASLKFLRTAIDDDKYHQYDNWGVYFRSQPFEANHKPLAKWTQKPAF